MNKTKIKGFTLLELLITVSLICVITMLAHSGFSALIQKQSTQNATRTLLSSLHFARSEAIKRNQKVSVCPSEDLTTCANQWGNGYIIYVINSSNTMPTVIRANQFNTPINITCTNPSLSITFSGDGRCLIRSTLTLSQETNQQKIVIYDSGRMRIQ